MKRQKDKLDVLKKEAEEERTRAREVARERVLKDFEKGHLGLSGGSSLIGTANSTSTAEGMHPPIIFPHSQSATWCTCTYMPASHMSKGKHSFPELPMPPIPRLHICIHAHCS